VEGSKISGNIAFKCTYNNGGKGIYVGFGGTCSDEIIKWNIDNGRAWCQIENGQCKRYYDNGFKGKRPNSPCYESLLFIDWEYGAGWDHYGVRGDMPRKILGAEEGKIAVITTLFPGDREEDRKIVGLYKIGDITPITDEDTETMIWADENYRIRLPEEEAIELYFWDFYKNKNSNKCFWGQGLFRYLSDVQVAQILKSVRETIKSEEEKSKIDKLLKEMVALGHIDVIPEPVGARKKNIIRANAIAVKRKYGSCGEGADHRKLKEWIASHPNILGISNVTKVEVEQHRFLSGDLPDIVFNFGKDMYAVVEIETFDTMPGAYQALKYKALMCAELRLPMTSDKVKSFLVAWDIPEDTRKFCAQYDIETIAKKV